MTIPILFAGALLAQTVMPAMNPLPPPAANQLQNGITVTASSSASALATSATIAIHVVNRNASSVLDAVALQPILDALTRAGAARSSVALAPPGMPAS